MIEQTELEDRWYEIVQKARMGLGYSMARVAEEAGVSYEALELWESGASAPNPTQLSLLARMLGLDAEKLLTLQQGGGFPVGQRVNNRGSLHVQTLTGHLRGYPVHAYLLYRTDEPDAVLIDTGYEPLHALEAVLHRRLLLRWVVLTHCHLDHMEGAPFLKAQTGARVAVPKAECLTYQAHHRDAPDLAVEEGSAIDVSPSLALSPILTPGHTVGGTSYQTGEFCAVGDALFCGSTGRAMSPAGYQTLLASLKARILSLPGDTILLPGHGPSTTVDHERRHNPFFPDVRGGRADFR
jgi:glyoxylase-like metal-dependent hydrolase (beta-lactamase superfamily II)